MRKLFGAHINYFIHKYIKETFTLNCCLLSNQLKLICNLRVLVFAMCVLLLTIGWCFICYSGYPNPTVIPIGHAVWTWILLQWWLHPIPIQRLYHIQCSIVLCWYFAACYCGKCSLHNQWTKWYSIIISNIDHIQILLDLLLVHLDFEIYLKELYDLQKCLV